MAPSGYAVCNVTHHCYVQIASAVFVRPPLATCGLTEQQAQARLTGDIDVFVSKFKPMKNTLSGRDEKTLMKIIVKVDTDEVSIAASSRAAVVQLVCQSKYDGWHFCTAVSQLVCTAVSKTACMLALQTIHPRQ